MMEMEMESLLAELVEKVRSRHYGKFRGLVKDIEDPEKMGRIKAEVPGIYGDLVSPWAMPSLPFAGEKHGLTLLPEPGDGVWIEFEGGDPTLPIWSGFWWAKGEIPEAAGAKIRSLVTRAGHQLTLDEDSNEIKLEHAGGSLLEISDQELRLSHSGGAELLMSDSELSLTLGGKKIVISSSGVDINDGAMEVK